MTEVKVNKQFGKINEDNLELPLYGMACYRCRSLLLRANITEGILEIQCKTCRSYTVFWTGINYCSEK